MTIERKQELAATITAMLQDLINEDAKANSDVEEKVQMITIKEAAEQVNGLSEHTVRQLVLQGKIPSMRTGEGKNGKILIPKAALLNYLTSGAQVKSIIE